MEHIQISDVEIIKKAKAIIQTMVHNGVPGYVNTPGWDPFDPDLLNPTVSKIQISDDGFWELCFTTIFYSGFRAQIVDNMYSDLMDQFGNCQRTARLGEDTVTEALSNRKVIRHERKIRSVVHNARQYLQVLQEFGSAQEYLASFGAQLIVKSEKDRENLDNLKSDLRKRFKFYGPAVTDHFLLRLGFQVIKADIVIRRLIYRLEITKRKLTTSQKDEQIANSIAEYIASMMGIPIKSLDYLFHWFGRMEGAQICTKKPKCLLCLVTPKCKRIEF